MNQKSQLALLGIAMHKANITGAEMAVLAMLAGCDAPTKICRNRYIHVLLLSDKKLVDLDNSGRASLTAKGAKILSELQNV